jgi:hypothetical protein
VKPAIDPRSAPLPEWRPEILYLLEHVGAVGLHPGTGACIEESPGGFSWDYLTTMASLHGVLPLLFKSISDRGAADVPDAVMARMRRDYYGIAQRNFIFAQELLRLVACFRDHDIVVVPYKGAPLAVTAYGDLSLRQFSDLDVLVKPGDVVRAKQLLEGLGYQARFIYGRRPLSQLTAAETVQFIKHRHEYEMQRKDGLLIDLHWQLAPRQIPFRIDPTPLWDRLVSVDFEGKTIPGFADEDLVLILCMHGAKDQWKKLIWILDLAKVMSKGRPLDWHLIFSRARDARMELPLLLGLQLVNDLFLPDMPPPMDTERRTRTFIAKLARETVGSLWEVAARPERFPVRSLPLKLCRNFSDKVHYACQALFVPRVADWALVRLPTWLNPLYFVLRPLNVLAGWAWNVIRSRVKGAGRARNRTQL